jgi:hypothetical protein
MKYFVGLGLGTAAGTLLFTGLLSAAHEFDWVARYSSACVLVLLGQAYRCLVRRRNEIDR